MKNVLWGTAIVIAAVAISACSKPNESGLRDSFAQQLAANRFIKDLQRTDDDLTFSGPNVEGGTATWRIHIDSVVIEPNEDAAQPYKGTVKSSWYSNDQLVRPSAGDSNLPIELVANGLSQDCWAFWVTATKRWSWE